MHATRWNLVVAVAFLLGSVFVMVKYCMFLSRPATNWIADVTYANFLVFLVAVTGATWFMARTAMPLAKWDLALIVPFVLLQASTWFRLSDYLAGRTNAAIFGICILYLWLGILAAGFLWGGYVALTLWQQSKVTHVHNVLRTVGICVMAISFLVAVFGPGPGGRAFQWGFQQWLAERNADIPSICAWQSGLDVKPGEMVPEDLWPPSVRTLKPRYVRFLGPRGGVDILWGGGFLDLWGVVVVGPAYLNIPSEDRNSYIVPFREGVYLHFRKG